ncbi:MAG TPA: FIST N-terminal domain-containing protein [Azospirillaceae bacterium]|nr:FIST N-terminal domain-containing protein [Azospirillaceae bacterium]
MTVVVAPPFQAAIATGPDWGQTVKACLDRLGDVRGANLGFVYITDDLADHAPGILMLLRSITGIPHWVGTVGLGVCGGNEEIYMQPGMAVMAARLPPDSFRLVPSITDDVDPFRRRHADWLAAEGPPTGLIHGDPRNPETPALADAFAEATEAFLVGGLASSRHGFVQFTGSTTVGSAAQGPVVEDGISGVLFSRRVPIATGLTQGCQPIGPVRTITESQDNVIHRIDGRPALEVFKEDIGELLARDLRRTAGYIFAALPIAGSDTADYLVRTIVGIDPARGHLAIGEEVEPGQPILFTRRDRNAAVEDLNRMLAGLERRLVAPPKAAIYVSCVARGPNLFGDESEELKTIRRAIGDVPLVGFFANGEFSHNRLYGYTGVLTLFL